MPLSMKYFITNIILLILLFYGEASNPGFHFIINITLVILFLYVNILWSYKVLNTDYEADFKMQSKRKAYKISELVGVVIISLIYWYSDIFKNKIIIILIFWIHPISRFLLWLIFKKKKLYTIFIKDNELFFNNHWAKKRNLVELTNIRFDQLNKNLCFVFKSKSEISIKTTLYKTEDIQKLLEILIEKSENEVTIPKNYIPETCNKQSSLQT